MVIELSEKDFDLLCDTGMRWSSTYDWAAQDGRFEVVEGEHIDWNLPMAYWVGDSPASLILAREYLKSQGARYQVLWDMAEHSNGEIIGFLIITDYVTGSWKNRDA